MAHNPHAPQGQEPAQDPAGSTQMFRAFVEESAPQRGPAAAPPRSSGPRVGLIVGIVVAVVVVAAAAWLALG
ncbi:hypothetical protein [Streptomyces sp. ODS28]|uniref:hypothetical protein n=1 Tax=Streptomyces sp. ODS28 TaxID=3136688 RepID=UPI0031F090FD